MPIPRTTTPSPNTNIRLPIRKRPDKSLQLREILDRADPHDPAVLDIYAILQAVARLLARFLPRFVQVLHELRVAFTRVAVADLLHGHVAARADDVAEVDEVVAAKTCEPSGFGTRKAVP